MSRPRMRAPWWLAAAALGFLVFLGCSHAAPESTPAFDPGPVIEIETPDHLIGRFLCDACTGEQTSEECIAHASFFMAHCRKSHAACLRHACVRLDDSEDKFIPTGARR